MEVKRSCNKEAQTGLRKQIVDRYLIEKGIDFGVFTVAFFEAKGLPKQYRPRWTTIEDARKDLHALAMKAQGELPASIHVETFVLDAKPE